jgi:hypothetical protein
MTTIPQSFRAGDYVTWIETEADEDATAVKAYLRTNAATGLTLTGVEVDTGWEFEITSAQSAALTVGDWQCQIAATVDAEQETVRVNSFTVLRSLVYTGSPAAVDFRTQAQQDLDAVDAAIRALTTGGIQEYWIGTGAGGRKVVRTDLAELIKWRDRLMAQVASEKRADDIANGLGDRRKVYIRFAPY